MQLIKIHNPTMDVHKFENWLEPETLEAVKDEFLSFNLAKCFGYNDKWFEFQKYTFNNLNAFPQTIGLVIHDLLSQEFINYLERLTGLRDLKPDPGLWGAGMHITLPHGYLAMHKDFNVLPTTYKSPKQYLRVLNVIGYFSPAQLKVGFNNYLFNPNQWAIFNPSNTYHGHPQPYTLSFARYSIAVYYYQELEIPRKDWRSTEYLKIDRIDECDEYKQKRKDRANIDLRYGHLM